MTPTLEAYRSHFSIIFLRFSGSSFARFFCSPGSLSMLYSSQEPVPAGFCIFSNFHCSEMSAARAGLLYYGSTYANTVM